MSIEINDKIAVIQTTHQTDSGWSCKRFSWIFDSMKKIDEYLAYGLISLAPGNRSLFISRKQFAANFAYLNASAGHFETLKPF